MPITTTLVPNLTLSPFPHYILTPIHNLIISQINHNLPIQPILSNPVQHLLTQPKIPLYNIPIIFLTHSTSPYLHLSHIKPTRPWLITKANLTYKLQLQWQRTISGQRYPTPLLARNSNKNCSEPLFLMWWKIQPQ